MIKKMLQQMQIMYWEAGRLSVWLSLVGIAAAICPPESCGSLNLSYPFWIHNTNCGYPGFQSKCKENTAGQLSPFLPGFVEHNIGDMDNDFEILEIDYNGSLIINSTSLKAMSCNGTDDAFVHFMLPVDGPFTISSVNKFVVIGCNSVGSFKVDTDPRAEGSCTSACLNQDDPEYCNTYGCCEAGIPGNKRMINFTGGGIRYENFTNCGFSTVLDPVTWSLPQEQLGSIGGGHYGVRLDWSIGRSNCTAAKGTSNYSCAEQAECIDQPTGHVCKCLPGYEGNGYSNGTDCTNIDECIHTDLNVCVVASEGGICTDLPGSYNCSCSKGYSGDGFQNGTRCQPLTSDNSVRSAIIGSVSSFIGVSLGTCGLFWWLKRRRLKQERDSNFLLNGGIQLQEHIASMGGRKTLRIFSEKELEIASNNYSSELGRGGFATVYKGVLLDGTQVAIKKPKAISPEFHNEVMIFSHINHRNTVKMLGCCLQTKFPLLVYEFVSNGTLHQHLHSMDKHLPWETRRQIAIETADAIAYMHHQTSQPIFHRDIKSSNILLDDTFTPKVADFGISRLRPSDEPHLNTMAAGTPGYLDPEFIRSDQYTDKSDVFSFGVVLVELLTGLKTLLSDQQGIVHTLYDHFLSAINQNRLTEILDSSVVNEENQAQMKNMSRLAQACLREKGRERPSMREVVEELACIRAATKHSGLHSDVSLVEHRGDSTQAKMNDYTLVAVGESKFEDPYAWPGHTQITTSEDPSTSLIEIRWSDMYTR